jgi:nitrogen-specific signal transduction histidine kinase
VLLHDGAIKVESDTDGTCFTIALPLNMQKKELLNSDEQVKDEIKI